MSSSLLVENGIEGKNLDKINLVLAAGRQLDSMIDELLILAKMQSGKMMLNLVEVDLNDLVASTLSRFSSLADSKNIQLKSQRLQQNYPVLADANLLHRVFDNLLSNALKFSHRGGTITLEIDYPSEPVSSTPAPKQAIIRITDEGIGIPEDLRQRIFDKYEVGNVINGISQLGLGLAFCKMVVEAHGGTIFVEANQPQGSIFSVVL
jgi:signal transduction histidine kinase